MGLDLAQMIELPGPSQTIYLVRKGVLDERSLAAFRLGQCHGLALAIAFHTEWPLVAVHSGDGTCNHICARRPDSRLIDVTGAHSEQEFEDSSPGCSLIPIDEVGIKQLVDEKGWAPPAINLADDFVEPVLALAERPPTLPASKGLAFRASRETDLVRVRFVWDGFAWMPVYLQNPTAGGEQWTRYGKLQLPIDPVRNAYVIDFNPEEFERIVDAWLNTQFDLRQALQRLRQ